MKTEGMFKYIILSTLVISFAACKKDDVQSFQGNSEIYFQKFYVNEPFPGKATADSTSASFFFYPDDTKELLMPLVVNFSGIPMEEDFTFSLKPVSEGTTAEPNEYELAPSYTFRGGLRPEEMDIQDTIYIKIKKSPRLNTLTTPARLVLELIPNETVQLGQTERRRAVLLFSSLTVQPEWWTKEVTDELLGQFSAKKFKLFKTEIDINNELDGEYIRTRPDNAKKMALQFKTWLLEQNPPIREDNGDLMTVPI